MKITRREHEWKQGKCIHCGKSFISELEWINPHSEKCIERVYGLEDYDSLPVTVESYCNWKGLHIEHNGFFRQEDTGKEFTLDCVKHNVNILNKKHSNEISDEGSLNNTKRVKEKTIEILDLFRKANKVSKWEMKNDLKKIKKVRSCALAAVNLLYTESFWTTDSELWKDVALEIFKQTKQ